MKLVRLANFNEAKRKTWGVPERVRRPPRGVESGATYLNRSVVYQPLTIQRDGAAVSQLVSHEVVCDKHIRVPFLVYLAGGASD